MLESTPLRWCLGIASGGILAWAVITWLWPSNPGESLQVAAPRLQELQKATPEQAGPLLTQIQTELSPEHEVRQVLLLQAIPDKPPLVVASMHDSSHDEPPTHWSSPWPAVNQELEAGKLEEQAAVTGRHGGFDYLHHLIPADETGSRVLLINQSAEAPGWSFQRLSLVAAGGLMLLVLAVTRQW